MTSRSAYQGDGTLLLRVMATITQRPTHRVLRDPRPGEIVRVPAGSRLEVRFRRRGLGLSRWQVEDRPAHLVPLEEGDHGFQFLVFHGDEDGRPSSLRLVRRRVDRPGSSEVRDLVVLVG